MYHVRCRKKSLSNKVPFKNHIRVKIHLLSLTILFLFILLWNLYGQRVYKYKCALAISISTFIY